MEIGISVSVASGNDQGGGAPPVDLNSNFVFMDSDNFIFQDGDSYVFQDDQ